MGKVPKVYQGDANREKQRQKKKYNIPRKRLGILKKGCHLFFCLFNQTLLLYHRKKKNKWRGV